MSLMALPTDVQIKIAGHLVMTSDWPLDDLRSLWATCSTMRHICGDPADGQRLALDQVRRGRTGADPINYYALLASLTQVGNLEACFLTGIPMVFKEIHRPRPCLNDLTHAVDDRHNLAAYLVTILLYRHNGNDYDNDTTRRYMRRCEGKEESLAAVVDQRVGGYATRGV